RAPPRGRAIRSLDRVKNNSQKIKKKHQTPLVSSCSSSAASRGPSDADLSVAVYFSLKKNAHYLFPFA
uniref:Uncharacterized protein n=1 Tax=Aegilops tauschii subsp. strangulata TaxID=200361 RepID=A0A453RJW1_AEGTS